MRSTWSRSTSKKRMMSSLKNRTAAICLFACVVVIIIVSQRRSDVMTEEGGLPTEDQLPRMSRKELDTAYHSYLDNIDIICRRKLRMGKLGDGGWEVCDDNAYRPTEPCIVYSFGISNDFSFDDEVAKLYNCSVYSFDPSMHRESYRRSEKVSFYNMGLGGPGGGLEAGKPTELKEHGRWKMGSLTDIKYMLHHRNKTLDILKMDIEGSEWIALAHMAQKGELATVRQLMVEFHLRHAVENDQDEARKRLPVLKAIERAGFKRYYTHLNPRCRELVGAYAVVRTTCYETYFLNTNMARSGW